MGVFFGRAANVATLPASPPPFFDGWPLSPGCGRAVSPSSFSFSLNGSFANSLRLSLLIEIPGARDRMRVCRPYGTREDFGASLPGTDAVGLCSAVPAGLDYRQTGLHAHRIRFPGLRFPQLAAGEVALGGPSLLVFFGRGFWPDRAG